MNLREIDLEKDYPMLCQWWEGHGWGAVPRGVLPKLGVLTEHEGQPLAAAWLYMDNSVGVSMMEWMVTNPAASPIATVRAVSHVITFLSERALELDYGVMLTSCRQPALVRLYERNGFMKTDEGVTHLLMPLRQPEEQ